MWEPAPQNGCVVSYSQVHLVSESGYSDQPYILAVIALDGGPQLMANIVQSRPEEVSIGAPVRLVLEEREGGWVLPHFALAERGTGMSLHKND